MSAWRKVCPSKISTLDLNSTLPIRVQQSACYPVSATSPQMILDGKYFLLKKSCIWWTTSNRGSKWGSGQSKPKSQGPGHIGLAPHDPGPNALNNQSLTKSNWGLSRESSWIPWWGQRFSAVAWWRGNQPLQLRRLINGPWTTWTNFKHLEV